MVSFLDFEKPIAELEARLRELRKFAGDGPSPGGETTKLEARLDRLLKDTYGKLDPWQKTQVARHPERPHFKDFIAHLVADFTPLAGDRAYADDPAIQAGLGRFRGRPVLFIGHEKGDTTDTRIKHNFGMARPEGYRKAIRLMRLADRFQLPVVSLVDTSGAYPGVGAEERGQAEAIARSTEACLDLAVPFVACIVGEGGSGGALAIAVGNRVLMFEHAIYSVISPEGCASILWRTAEKAKDAAHALKITAEDLLALGVIDEIVPEPVGGAHRNPKRAIAAMGDAIERTLRELLEVPGAKLKSLRRQKFLSLGTPGIA